MVIAFMCKWDVNIVAIYVVSDVRCADGCGASCSNNICQLVAILLDVW